MRPLNFKFSTTLQTFQENVYYIEKNYSLYVIENHSFIKPKTLQNCIYARYSLKSSLCFYLKPIRLFIWATHFYVSKTFHYIILQDLDVWVFEWKFANPSVYLLLCICFKICLGILCVDWFETSVMLHIN